MTTIFYWGGWTKDVKSVSHPAAEFSKQGPLAETFFCQDTACLQAVNSQSDLLI